MSTLLTTDRKNNQKGMRTSLFVHALLLLLAFFIGCPYDPDKALETQYAVVVDFEKPEFVEFTNSESSNSNKAESTSGEAKKKTDPITEIKSPETKVIEANRPEVKIKLPNPSPPTPDVPIVSETTSEEETDIEAVEDEIQFDEPEMDPLPDPEPDPVPDPPSSDKPLLSKIKDILTGSSSSSSSPNQNPGNNPSQTDGSGTGKGNSGTGKGNNSSGNDGDSGIGTGGTGTGEYDDSGDGVFGRKVIYRNYKEVLRVEFGNQAGKRIVAKFCVNKQGVVTYAELIDSETNAIIPNGREGRKQVLRGIYGYKVEQDMRAPAEQCGKLSIVLTEINALIGG